MHVVDPKAAIDVARETADLFRRDYLVASVVVLLFSNVAWGMALRNVLRKLSEVQDKRVLDQLEGERRAEALLTRMATHMDRSTEAALCLLSEAQATRQRRRGSKEAPALSAEPTSQVKKLGGT